MEPHRALAVSAHPDDIEFACAGTMAAWVDEGWDVRYVLVTSGQRGVQDPHADPDEFGAIREKESLEAARACGVENVTFLRYMDSDLIGVDPLALRKDLSRQFRRHRPHRLVTVDPEILPTNRWVNHPDHRTVAIATLDVTMTGGTTGAIFPELALEEDLPPWRELEEVWLSVATGGTTAVDVTSTIDRKIAALRAHASQLGEWDPEPFVRERLHGAGEPHGFEYAETYRVIDFRRG
jgi:LmbE family N-acetylglucosaminyl deacetylase